MSLIESLYHAVLHLGWLLMSGSFVFFMMREHFFV